MICSMKQVQSKSNSQRLQEYHQALLQVMLKEHLYLFQVTYKKIADYFELMKSDIDPRFAPRKKNHELKIPTSPLVNKITKAVVELNVHANNKY